MNWDVALVCWPSFSTVQYSSLFRLPLIASFVIRTPLLVPANAHEILLSWTIATSDATSLPQLIPKDSRRNTTIYYDERGRAAWKKPYPKPYFHAARSRAHL